MLNACFKNNWLDFQWSTNTSELYYRPVYIYSMYLDRGIIVELLLERFVNIIMLLWLHLLLAVSYYFCLSLLG